MHLRTFAAVMTALLITAAAVGAPIEYPKTKKVEQVDDYHGTKVADPYRWLETDVRTSKDVADWVAAENKITFDYLGTIPEREPIRKQLTTLWNYEKYSTPYKRGGHYFFSKNNGLQNQSVVYTVDKWGDTPRVLLDPNGWSKDGTVALGGVAVSDDAKYVAYAVAEAGSDWQTIRVAEVANGSSLPTS
jgi:prolyl oligopeptidase